MCVQFCMQCFCETQKKSHYFLTKKKILNNFPFLCTPKMSIFKLSIILKSLHLDRQLEAQRELKRRVRSGAESSHRYGETEQRRCQTWILVLKNATVALKCKRRLKKVEGTRRGSLRYSTAVGQLQPGVWTSSTRSPGQQRSREVPRASPSGVSQVCLTYSPVVRVVSTSSSSARMLTCPCQLLQLWFHNRLSKVRHWASLRAHVLSRRRADSGRPLSVVWGNKCRVIAAWETPAK